MTHKQLHSAIDYAKKRAPKKFDLTKFRKSILSKERAKISGGLAAHETDAFIERRQKHMADFMQRDIAVAEELLNSGGDIKYEREKDEDLKRHWRERERAEKLWQIGLPYIPPPDETGEPVDALEGTPHERVMAMNKLREQEKFKKEKLVVFAGRKKEKEKPAVVEKKDPKLKPVREKIPRVKVYGGFETRIPSRTPVVEPVVRKKPAKKTVEKVPEGLVRAGEKAPSAKEMFKKSGPAVKAKAVEKTPVKKAPAKRKAPSAGARKKTPVMSSDEDEQEDSPASVTTRKKLPATSRKKLPPVSRKKHSPVSAEFISDSDANSDSDAASTPPARTARKQPAHFTRDDGEEVQEPHEPEDADESEDSEDVEDSAPPAKKQRIEPAPKELSSDAEMDANTIDDLFGADSDDDIEISDADEESDKESVFDKSRTTTGVTVPEEDSGEESEEC